MTIGWRVLAPAGPCTRKDALYSIARVCCSQACVHVLYSELAPVGNAVLADMPCMHARVQRCRLHLSLVGPKQCIADQCIMMH